MDREEVAVSLSAVSYGLTKKVVERLCEGGTTEAISLNDRGLSIEIASLRSQ